MVAVILKLVGGLLRFGFILGIVVVVAIVVVIYLLARYI